MYKKECPYCEGTSYSSDNYREWKCPYCGKDISFVKAEREGETD